MKRTLEEAETIQEMHWVTGSASSILPFSLLILSSTLQRNIRYLHLNTYSTRLLRYCGIMHSVRQSDSACLPAYLPAMFVNRDIRSIHGMFIW